MDWLLLAALGIIWAVFLIPSVGRRRVHSPSTTVEEFGHNMDLLAGAEGPGEGRWVVTPRKGVRFVGARERRRARVRDRRRRVLLFLAEATGVVLLIGLFPPLRGMLTLGVALAGMTGAYVLLLLHIKNIESGKRIQAATSGARGSARFRAAAPQYSSGQRFVAVGESRMPRPSYAGLAAFGEGDDSVHVVVRDA